VKFIISEPGWGNLVLEDTETGEVSFQCVCGGIGVYSNERGRCPRQGQAARRLRKTAPLVPKKPSKPRVNFDEHAVRDSSVL
jgi:hypothetical protein